MCEAALLLVGSAESADESPVATVLEFFGVSWRASTVDAALTSEGPGLHAGRERLLCSAQALFEWVRQFGDNGQALTLWRERVHSAFVHGTDSAAVLQDVVRLISDDPGVSLTEDRSGAGEVSVTGDMSGFCGTMSGVRCQTSGTAPVWTVGCHQEAGRERLPIVNVGDGSAFFRLDVHGVPVFVSTATVVDLRERVSRRRFDVREHFFTAVPAAMYIRWAFPRSAWRSPETNACLVIDDPLLKPRYGFLDYRTFLALMQREAFTTSIAFIPWNWRRSDPSVVGIFEGSGGRYSLCVHGCDHTAAEFGTSDAMRLHRKVTLAVNRMERHRQLTGLQHDMVMVFPQGVFSRAALRALKCHGFVGAVNTGVLSADADQEPVTIADVWDTAVSNYDGFPIFTRRYPSEGLANFAFDAFLGKPCLVVIHHDDLHDNAAGLSELVRSLNALKGRLSWRSLGEVVRRSHRQRGVAPGIVEVKMYGSELHLDIPAGEPGFYRLTKKEPDVSDIDAVTLNSKELAWGHSPAGIRVDVALPPGELAAFRVAYKAAPAGAGHVAEGLPARLVAGARRYASEVRDNYVTPWRHAYHSCVARLKT